ncbi:MAG TPA: aminotransferase class I/II-fold pyridoxal phosphate-dependent enzyme [Candidatus Elarobacter sp.]|jgi:aspartate/methionine/tyrosine aminotransferase|nr:aminotransferase class I/II-fold pyridoxal phosphate-dependent enzyme [Candidatus Elarobacter sp.]
MMVGRRLAGVSAEIAAMPRSGIREIMDAAWEVPDAIRLAVGEPNFPTPPHVVEAAHAAALAGKTGYVSNAGIPELRDALAAKIRARNGYDVAAENVIVTSGGVEGIFAALAAVLAPGDGILLPDPGWPNFAMMATILRARIQPYTLVPEHGFLPTLDELERCCDAGTRVLLLNSPSNPLGAVIDRARMREIADFAEAHDLWIVSDECYDATLFDDRFVSAAAVADPERTIAIYTFSKTYAMTGWRVGYVAAPARATTQIAKLQEPLISCVNAPAQYAALAALTGPQDVVAEMNRAYRERRDEVLRRLTTGGVPALTPSGAFYVWADVRAGGPSSRDFAFALLREHGVAIAPGTAFGPRGEGFARISLASEPSELYEGIDRLITALRG